MSKMYTQASATPFTHLEEDRLRNGEFLIDLFALLEPHVCRHVNLLTLTHRRPNTVGKAMENLERVLWLFRISRCPPIPLRMLLFPHALLQGDKMLIWGLLWHIMQAYGYSAAPTGEGSPSSVAGIHQRPLNQPYAQELPTALPAQTVGITAAAGRWPHLGYTTEQRRKLDQSLVMWLHERCPFLKPWIGQLALPCTILAFESPIRDGTLLCGLVDVMLYGGTHVNQDPAGRVADGSQVRISRSGAFVWNRSPHSYDQCLSNVHKAVERLRQCALMSPRFLHARIEEDIVQGDWNAVLGLLEDMHRLDDKQPPAPTLSLGSGSLHPPAPYLGSTYDQYVDFHRQQQTAKVSVDIMGLYGVDESVHHSILEEEQQFVDSLLHPQGPGDAMGLVRGGGDIVPTARGTYGAEDLYPASRLPEGIQAQWSTVTPRTKLAKQSADDVFPLRTEPLDERGRTPGEYPVKVHVAAATHRGRDAAHEMSAVDAVQKALAAQNPHNMLLDAKFDETVSVEDEGSDSSDVSEVERYPVSGSGQEWRRKDTRAPMQQLLLQKHYAQTHEVAVWLLKYLGVDLWKERAQSTDHRHGTGSSALTDASADSLLLGKALYEWLPSLRDGVVLVRITQRLLHLDAVVGTTLKPKTHGHRVQNVRRSLQALAQTYKHTPTSQWIVKEREVVDGKPAVILELLSLIKRTVASH